MRDIERKRKKYNSKSYMGSKSLTWWHNPGLQVQVLPLFPPSSLPPLHLTSSSKERWHPSYRNVVGPGSAGWGWLGNRERQRDSFLVGSSLITPGTTTKALWLSWGWNPSNQQACFTSPGHPNGGRSVVQITTKSTQRSRADGWRSASCTI